MEIGESVVQAIILHKVGNRLRDEPLVLTDQCFSITDSISNVILGGYLRGIVSDKNQYILGHESDITLNDVAHHVSGFFAKKISFVELSQNLASHLYSSAHHPNIAPGDLFVILFEKLKVDGVYQSAIGIYKSESKQQYLSARTNGDIQQLEVSSGINPDLIDKGVLVINGSTVIYAIDRLSSRTKYWIEDFLRAKQLPNASTKSAVATGIIEKIREKIENPMARQEFSRDIIALCADKDQVRGEDMKEVADRYVAPKVWETELDKLVERKGLIDAGEITVPAKSLQLKLKRLFNRIALGYDVGLIVPEGLSLSDVNFKIDGKFIEVKLTLEKSNG